jgi:hypothetical protein
MTITDTQLEAAPNAITDDAVIDAILEGTWDEEEYQTVRRSFASAGLTYTRSDEVETNRKAASAAALKTSAVRYELNISRELNA